MDQNTKISDSAYSNSCSNSQSRTSGSSKSRHSNSSNSSGYGRSISNNNDPKNLLKRLKEKDRKNKKLKCIIQTQTSIAADSNEQASTSKSEQNLTNETISSDAEKPVDKDEIKQNLDDSNNVSLTQTFNKSVQNDENENESIENNINLSNATQEATTEIQQQQVKIEKSIIEEQGFCCVISMHDGVVLYTTPSITASLGFPRDMWLGRSFIGEQI